MHLSEEDGRDRREENSRPKDDAASYAHVLRDLETERARLNAIIAHAPEGIVITDEKGRIIHANPTAEEIYQRPVPYGEDYESHAALAFSYPDGTPYIPRDLPLTRSVLDGETVLEEELVITLPDGRERDLLVNTAPLRDEQGKIMGGIGIFQDITERVWAQEALKHYTNRLEVLHRTDQAILEARSVAEIAESIVPHLRRIKAGLRLFVAEFHLESQEMKLLAAHMERESAILKPGACISLDEIWYLDTLKQGSIYTLEDMQTLRSQSVVAEALREEGAHALFVFPLRAQRELLGGLHVAVEDTQLLTAEEEHAFQEVADELAVGLKQARLRKALEREAVRLEERVERRTAALRASEARFRAIFDGAAIGIALLDEQGCIVESNPALEALLGRTSHELEDECFTNLIHPDDVGAARAHYRSLLAGEQAYYRHELRLIDADDKPLTANVTVSLIAPEENKQQFAIAMMEDITKRKLAQAELIQTEKLALTGRLAASLAHEINNPLQTVIGALGLAKEIDEEGGDIQRYLDISLQELERAARIVADLRDLNRPSNPEAEGEMVDVNEMIEQVLVLTEKRRENYDIDCTWETAPEASSVLMVRDRIQQVFLNLILNAIDAMPEGGEIKIAATCTYDPDGVTITFTDTGVGIDAEAISSLFDPFYTTKPDGVGLGLYITKFIVENHNGHIEVESEPDEGTTFTVWLPA